MNAQNIPKKDKVDALLKGLTALLPIAEELAATEVHKLSPHIGGVLGRIRGGIQGVGYHVKFLTDLPDPKPSTVADAKAGTTAS